MSFFTIRWEGGRVVLLDQTRLPDEEVYLACETPGEVVDAIRRLSVRGAPAIGVAGAYGVALAAHRARETDPARFRREVDPEITELRAARPTAVNLAWAVDRMVARLDALGSRPVEELKSALLEEARAIHREDEASCREIGRLGAEMLPASACVLTHCNAGALATAGMGTALAVVYAAHAAGKNIRVLSDETRPLLQGARLTAWECQKMGVPVTLLCDGAAGWALSQHLADRVIVGADRIAANGDTANKIGTYPLALLAREHGVPFWVAAPFSTIDLSVTTGAGIPIEQRSPDEVTAPRGVRIAPEGVDALNPAFDVTPNALIAAIVTDRGVATPPYVGSLRRLARG